MLGTLEDVVRKKHREHKEVMRHIRKATRQETTRAPKKRTQKVKTGRLTRNSQLYLK